ncbi:MAG: divergent PAP2 family protein [Lachnospiraceae bacterium]|nr:divergent PAP2 family protein [Lachnospiraceae bacterium]
MEFITGVLGNRIIMTGGITWCVAQVIKMIVYMIENKEFNPERLVGDGGMPSCHSATVCSVAVAAAITEGASSPVFGLSVILAIVVMHDAMGVRRESGKQAEILNLFMDLVRPLSPDEVPDERLKEFIGHTPIQVAVGAILGIASSLILNLLIWKMV